jgi:hypothetical protein
MNHAICSCINAALRPHAITLQESRATLQESRATLQESRATLQESRATLQESRASLGESCVQSVGSNHVSRYMRFVNSIANRRYIVSFDGNQFKEVSEHRHLKPAGVMSIRGAWLRKLTWYLPWRAREKMPRYFLSSSDLPSLAHSFFSSAVSSLAGSSSPSRAVPHQASLT